MVGLNVCKFINAFLQLINLMLYYVINLFQALVLQQKGNLMELVDLRLGTEFNEEEAIRMAKVALLCTNSSPALRPTMSEVVNMLEGRTNPGS